MKCIVIVIVCVLLAGCTIQFKSKDLEFDAKPAEPGMTWSMASAEFDPVKYLKKGD